MKYKWLNKQNNNLIVFMNGWAMDENVVKHLQKDDYDILMINDYREFDYDISKLDFEKYKNKYLISWSMGVYISGFFENIFNDFDKKIAIAGTQKIIDNNYGIPEKIYNLTVNHFSEKSADKFIKNMFKDDNCDIRTNKTMQELKDELVSIQNFVSDSKIKYDKAIIPALDIIVPYKNQLKYWIEQNVEIVEINSPHFVFNNFSCWQEFIC